MTTNPTMLEFSDDSDRLRHVARAHAAGDIDQEDYRQIRTAVLEGLDAAAGAAADDTGAVAPAAPVEQDMAPWRRRDFGDQPGQLLVLVAAGAAAVLALVAGMLLTG